MFLISSLSKQPSNSSNSSSNFASIFIRKLAKEKKIIYEIQLFQRFDKLKMQLLETQTMYSPLV